MSTEIDCRACGEEVNTRRDHCPACWWRAHKRVPELEEWVRIYKVLRDAHKNHRRKLEVDLAERNKTLDKVDKATKQLEIKIDNLGHNTNLVIEAKTQLEADLEERTKQLHLAETKVMSREAIIEQLSETELAKDVTRLEGESEALHILRDVVDWSTKSHRERYQEGTMKCELCEAWDKYSGKIALLKETD